MKKYSKLRILKKIIPVTFSLPNWNFFSFNYDFFKELTCNFFRKFEIVQMREK